MHVATERNTLARDGSQICQNGEVWSQGPVISLLLSIARMPSSAPSPTTQMSKTTSALRFPCNWTISLEKVCFPLLAYQFVHNHGTYRMILSCPQNTTLRRNWINVPRMDFNCKHSVWRLWKRWHWWIQGDTGNAPSSPGPFFFNFTWLFEGKWQTY